VWERYSPAIAGGWGGCQGVVAAYGGGCAAQGVDSGASGGGVFVRCFGAV